MSFAAGAPSFWVVLDKSGKAAIGGQLEAYRASAIQEKKAIYQDPGGLIEWPNPLPVTSGGILPKIYFNTDEPYYLIFRQSDGEVIYTDGNFTPGSGGGSPIVNEYVDTFNHFANGQFDFPFDIPSPLTTAVTPIVQNWNFVKSNTNATDAISVTRFTPGANEPSNWEGTPINYITYECTGVGAGGETYKDFYTELCDVLGFAGDEISFAIQGYSSTLSTIQIIATQNFGTGGSPSADVNTILASFTLTASPAKYTVTATLPSISGKTIGSNNDGKLIIKIRMPLNAISTVIFTNAQWIHNNIVPEYDHQTHDYVNAMVMGAQIPIPANDGSDANKSLSIASDGKTLEWRVPGVVGEEKAMTYEVTENTGEWTGWLKQDGRALSRTAYATLNTIYSNAGYPWGNGDGSTTFNIPDMRGRAGVGSGTGSGLTARTVGQTFGEETHALTGDENGPHEHQEYASATGSPFSQILNYRNGASNGFSITGTSVTNAGAALNTASSGLGAPHNNMQPSSVKCYLIKVI